MGLRVRATLLRGSRRLRATREHQASRGFSGPSARRVGPKVLAAFDQEKGAQSAQSAAIRSRMRRRSLALQLRRCLSRVQRVFLSKGASPARASAWTSARWILSMAWLRFLRI